MPIPTPERDAQTLLQKSRLSGTHRINKGFTKANFSLGKLPTLNSWYSQSRAGSSGACETATLGFCLGKTSHTTDYTRALGDKGPRGPLDGFY